MAEQKEPPVKQEKRKTRVSQADVPAFPLDEALCVATALRDHYAFSGATPIDVATALDMTPTSSKFRMLCGASIAYGLTDGGYNAQTIEPTELARRILEPTDESQEAAGRYEATLKPRVIEEFLTKYDRKRLPDRDDIAQNILVQMGVPRDSTTQTLELILRSAEGIGVIRDVKGSRYIQLKSSTQPSSSADQQEATSENSGPIDEQQTVADGNEKNGSVPVSSVHPPVANQPKPEDGHLREGNRVFIAHGKNVKFVDSLKEILELIDLEAVVSVENQTVSKPIPDKFIQDMRDCSAAIIHVDVEAKYRDENGDEKVSLNPNVLIEIGAAIALYGRRFILLVRKGIELPTNLQGLYEVRYDGEKLDSDSTIRILKAIRDMKNHPLPN